VSRVIRPSGLTTAADCLRRWAAHHLPDELLAGGYVLSAGRPLHVGAAVGSGVHAAASYIMVEKRLNGSLGNEAEAIDRAEAEFDDRGQYGLAWDGSTPDLSTAKKQLARMAKTYRRQVAPDLSPLLVEQRLDCEVGDGWTVSGQVDTLGGDPDDEIEDLKTGARQRANGVQYATYAMVFRAHGYRVLKLYERFLQRVRISDEQPDPVRTEIELEPSVQDAWELIETIKAATQKFNDRLNDPNGRSPAAAFPANPASVLCGAKWCRAFGTDFCRAHLR
jgi:hypothetical protein